MNGQMTIPGVFSAFREVAGSQAPVSNPFVAIMIVVAHLLSDAFTPMGIPAPGWTLVNSAQFGELGTRRPVRGGPEPADVHQGL